MTHPPTPNHATPPAPAGTATRPPAAAASPAHPGDPAHAGDPVDPAAGDWVTRKQAAVLAGCSEDTIKRAVREHQLPTRTAANHAVLVRAADLVAIGKLPPAEAPAAGNAAALLAELRATQAELAAAREQVAALTGRLAERAGALEQLEKQLAVKDRQVEALLRSLGHLSAAAGGRLGGAA